MLELPEDLYLRTMSENTVRLVRNAEALGPDSGIASGVLLETESPDELVLLTAGHIFDKDGVWTMETSAIANGRTLHAAVRDVQRFDSVDLSTGETEKVDIAWGRVLFEDIREGLRTGGLTGQKVELPIYRGPRDRVPTKDEEYGFSTFTQPIFFEDLGKFERSPCYELGMTYAETRSDGTYVFDLARPHQGDGYYEGASGSPVSDPEGAIIGVLIGSDPDTKQLLVTPLAAYAPLFNIKQPPPDVP